jgi:hypothetical protein
MGTNKITGLGTPSADSDAATKKYVDDNIAGFVTASSVDTFTNKTFDANDTGNSITNIEVADLAGSAVVTAAETIAANDNDTTFPTSAAVKAYADSVGGLGNVVEDTTPQLGGDLDLNSNNITGTGNINITGQITSSGSITNGTLEIDNGVIQPVTTNSDLTLQANGTGKVQIESISILGDTITGSNADTTITMNGNGVQVNVPYTGALGATFTLDRSSGVQGGESIYGSDGSVTFYRANPSEAVGLQVGQAGDPFVVLQHGAGQKVRIYNQNSAGGTLEVGKIDANSGNTLTLETNTLVSGGGVTTPSLTAGSVTSNEITSNGSNADINIDPQGTGNVSLGNFVFDVDQTVGAGQDNYVLTYDDASGTISLEAAAGGTITALNNQAENRLTTIGSTTTELDGEANLTFDGSTLTLTGSAALDGVTITDNSITTNRSNDDLFISANGTGAIHIAGDDSNLFDSTLYSNLAGTANRGNTIIATVESVDAGSVPERSYNSIISHNTTLTGSGTDSNFRPRAISATSNIDLAGYSYTNASFSRGPVGGSSWGEAENSGAGASTLATLRGLDAGAFIQDYSNHNQDITVDNAMGVRINNGIENNGTGALTFTNAYDFYANAYADNFSSGSATITNHYAFYTPGTGGTNNYAFYSASDTAVSRVGSLERYREEINTLTSSSTITVDCGLAPVHTVALGTNTGFVITNLGTGQSVTIIIKSSGTYTATFGTDGSTAVKFPGGAPTITDSGTDVVTIFNDGTDYLGNIAQAYA